LENVPLARFLLEKGAKVQYFGRHGGKFSPMHAARSAEMVQLLLGHNADPAIEDGIERRPLHWYAIRDEIAAMRAIVQHGAEVNPDGPMTTPLHEAAQRDLDTVKLLMEHGEDVEVRDFQQHTPLHLAATTGKTDVVKFLIERWPEGMRERDDCWNTLSHWAVATGHTQVVGLLVEGWPEATMEKNKFGDTPLHLAAAPLMIAGTEMVSLLVKCWPEGKEGLDKDGKTPLQLWFEEDSRRTGKLRFSDEEKEEIIALLGGP
jgi:ankyrin repeat protein